MPERRFHFIDANIPMYAVGGSHPLKSPCVAILEAVARGELRAVTDAEVLQEILHRYTALGQRDHGIEVCRLFLQVVPEVIPITAETIVTALEVHRRFPDLNARDSLHVAVMFGRRLRYIISADRHFDSVPGITRLDPQRWS